MFLRCSLAQYKYILFLSVHLGVLPPPQYQKAGYASGPPPPQAPRSYAPGARACCAPPRPRLDPPLWCLLRGWLLREGKYGRAIRAKSIIVHGDFIVGRQTWRWSLIFVWYVAQTGATKPKMAAQVTWVPSLEWKWIFTRVTQRALPWFSGTTGLKVCTKRDWPKHLSCESTTVGLQVIYPIDPLCFHICLTLWRVCS